MRAVAGNQFTSFAVQFLSQLGPAESRFLEPVQNFAQ
jgi:hypothetical protein